MVTQIIGSSEDSLVKLNKSTKQRMDSPIKKRANFSKGFSKEKNGKSS